MLQNGFWGRHSQHSCHTVVSQKQSQYWMCPSMFPYTCSAKGNLIVCPVKWLTKAINFSGKIRNKVHLYHNPCNIFCNMSFTLFRWVVYPSAWTLLTNVCYIKKVLNNFEISSTFCNWHLVDNLYLEQFHGPPLPLKNSTIWLRWSVFLNLWTVFTMEAIVLVAVLTSSAKIYDLGPLQDSYPAKRRPSKFHYRNSVTKM